MKTMFLMLVSLAALDARAELPWNHVWAVTGENGTKMEYDTGDKDDPFGSMDCSAPWLAILQEEDTLTIMHDRIDCYLMVIEKEATQFKIQGKDLFFDGHKIGTLSEKEISFSAVLDGYDWRLNLRRKGITLDYLQSWKNEDGETRIHGTMTEIGD